MGFLSSGHIIGHLVDTFHHEVDSEPIHFGTVLKGIGYFVPRAIFVLFDGSQAGYINERHLERISGVEFLNKCMITFFITIFFTTSVSFSI